MKWIRNAWMPGSQQSESWVRGWRQGSRHGLVLAAAISGVAAASAPVARAAGPVWRDLEPISLRLFDHVFDRAMVNDAGCAVRVRLYFDAPAEAYREPDAARNHYRFLAEVKLTGGHKFVSEVFDNGEPGARVFAFSHDTTSEGCWASEEHQLRKVDVHACRGALCKPQKFR